MEHSIQIAIVQQLFQGYFDSFVLSGGQLIETTSKYDINRKKYVSKWTIQNLKSQDNNEFVFT